MSTEREISLKSGTAVYHALIQKGYSVVAIDVGRDIYSKITKERIDIAFIALHGKYGEDGTIQGLLEIMGIPYTGSGVLASAISINKVLAKKLFMLMLRLNNNDNQGARYLIASLYAKQKWEDIDDEDMEKEEKLLQKQNTKYQFWEWKEK